MNKYIAEGQISIFDKPKIELIKDWTKLHPLLTKSSIHEVFLERENYYIILIEETFYGIYREDARICWGGKKLKESVIIVAIIIIVAAAVTILRIEK